jgi:heme exporter protein CcmD
MSLFDLPHIGFVIASYGAALVVVVLLIGWVMRDYGTLRRALAAQQAKGADPAAADDNLR